MFLVIKKSHVHRKRLEGICLADFNVQEEPLKFIFLEITWVIFTFVSGMPHSQRRELVDMVVYIPRAVLRVNTSSADLIFSLFTRAAEVRLVLTLKGIGKSHANIEGQHRRKCHRSM